MIHKAAKRALADKAKRMRAREDVAAHRETSGKGDGTISDSSEDEEEFLRGSGSTVHISCKTTHKITGKEDPRELELESQKTSRWRRSKAGQRVSHAESMGWGDSVDHSGIRMLDEDRNQRSEQARRFKQAMTVMRRGMQDAFCQREGYVILLLCA